MKDRGFTLIELTVVLTIMVALLGLVIVRVGGWSSRQSLAASARALGNTIRTFREKAQFEERLYDLTLDPQDGSYEVRTHGEADRYAVPSMESVRKGHVDDGQSFGKVIVGSLERTGPVILYLDPKGVMPVTQITLRNGHDERVTLTVGAIVNEIDYAESE